LGHRVILGVFLQERTPKPWKFETAYGFKTVGDQLPGGRYVDSLAIASSTCAGVSSGTVLVVAPPPALTVNAAAAAETSSGKSAMR
jgi:hypothetical protein